jgi:hypothetical protein
MTEAVEDRYAARSLDERGDRTDVCPSCGGERRELVLPPHALFYCPECEASTIGPNTEAPERAPEQANLFDPAEAVLAEEEAPLDEGMAWVGTDERPDE